MQGEIKLSIIAPDISGASTEHETENDPNPIDEFIPKDIQKLYEIHNYRNAAQVLATGCAAEFQELLQGLRAFRLTIADIRKAGGNESDIPKRISGLLRAKGWSETRIKGDLLITKISRGRRQER